MSPDHYDRVRTGIPEIYSDDFEVVLTRHRTLKEYVRKEGREENFHSMNLVLEFREKRMSTKEKVIKI